MKKNMIIAAAVLASAVACTKEIEEPSALDGKVQMSFAVSTEQTKTVLEGTNKTLWTGVEKLSIFDGESNNLFGAELSAPSATAQFTGKAKEAQTYYALYPYNSAAKLSGTTISTELPAAQTAASGTFDPSAALLFGVSDGTSVTLKNVTAMLKLTVPANVTSIEVDGNGTALAGSVNVNVSTAEVSGATATKVTLAGKGALEAGTYYIAVAPATVSGLSVKLIDSVNSKYILRSVEASRTLAANTIYDMGDFSSLAWTSEGGDTPAADELVIFDEAMQNSWVLGGTDGKYSIKDGIGKDGGKGIEWVLDDNSKGWARVLTFELPANTDISGYTKLCFDIEYVNSTFEATWNVFTNRVYGDGTEMYSHVTAPENSGWNTVEMPLDDFTLQSGTKDWTKFKTFCFHTNAWNSGTATVHIDNVRLVKSSGSSEPEQPKEDAQIIFDEAMQNSWVLGGTDGKYSIAEGIGKDGGKGIEWVLDDNSKGWARVLTFELPANTDISGYTKLCFDIEYVNSTFEATWNVFTNRVYGDGTEMYSHVTAPENSGWNTVEMPLVDFTLQSGTKDWTKFKTFCFHTNGWNAGTATVHIDNVRLVK